MAECKCTVWDARLKKQRRCKSKAVAGQTFCSFHSKKCGSVWVNPWSKVRDTALLAGCRARITALQGEVSRLRKLVPKRALPKKKPPKVDETGLIVQALLLIPKGVTVWSVAERRAEEELANWHEAGVFKTTKIKRQAIIDMQLYPRFKH